MKSLFVHLVDQIQYEPEIAQLAALLVLRHGEGAARLLLTDYGTDDAAVTRALAASPAELVFLRITAQTAAVVRHACGRLRAAGATALPILHGPLCATAPEVAVEALEGGPGLLLAAESEAATTALIEAMASGVDPLRTPPAGCTAVTGGELRAGAEVAPLAADAFPNPHFGVFGGGSLFHRGIGCSFFGETGVFPIEVAIGTPCGAPANAALEPFCRHLPGTPRVRGEQLLRDRLRQARLDFGELRHVEVRDRELGFDTESARRIARVLAQDHPDLGWTARMLPDTASLDLLPELASAGATRLVLEYDAPDEATRALIGDAQNPQRVEAAVRAAHDAGMETGLLVGVGLPGETPEALRSKLASIREWGVARVRFLPFEPRFGHPVWDLCRSRGMLSDDPEAWNREVYRPLIQDAMPIEAWWKVWQECLNLQAELHVSDRTVFA